MRIGMQHPLSTEHSWGVAAMDHFDLTVWSWNLYPKNSLERNWWRHSSFALLFLMQKLHLTSVGLCEGRNCWIGMIDHHRLTHLSTWFPSGRIAWEGLGGVALLEEACHLRCTLRFQKANCHSQWALSLRPTDSSRCEFINTNCLCCHHGL